MEHDNGGAKEHRVDLVEIAAGPLEDRGEWGAMIGRRRGRHARPDLRELGVVGPDPDGDAAAVQDGIVRAADGLHFVLRHRRQWRDAKAGDDLVEVKFQLMELVQGRLQ